NNPILTMENKVRNKHSATTSSGQPEKSPEDSPLSSIVSSLSSLSHGFEDDEDQHSVQPETSPHGSPPLEPIPDLSRARVTSSSSPPPVPVVNRYVREETVPIKKTDKAAEDVYVGRLPESKGWALDSYYRYKEFRYCMGVNVIGFAYSVLQGCDLVYQLATGSHGTRRHYLRYYFDFAMDQASFLDLVLLFFVKLSKVG
nr:CASP-like protein 4A3 [Tanacetum cinerariifolium]